MSILVAERKEEHQYMSINPILWKNAIFGPTNPA